MAKRSKKGKTRITGHRLRLLLVALLPLLLYANTLGHDFALDDSIVITENMFTSDGLAGWRGILTKDTFFGFFKEEGKAQLVSGGRYRPFSLLWFALIREIFGADPLAFHLFNVLLYSGCSVLLFLVLERFLRHFPKIRQPSNLALVASLIFIAHPVHTEVVANVKGADEIFALGFSLIALWMALVYARVKNGRYLLWMGLAFFLALLSKESAIPWLGVIPVAIYFGRFGPKTAFRVAFAAGAVLLLYLAVRYAVLGFGPTSEAPMELMNNPFLKVEGGRYIPLDPGERWATVIYGLGYYLRLLFYPHPLVHDYYPRQIAVMNWADWRVWLSLIAYAALAAIAVAGWKKKRLMSFAAFYYLATLSIVSNILFPVGTHLSERFLFAPSLAFCLFGGWFVWEKVKPGWGRNLSIAMLAALLMVYSIKTITRNPVWKDNFTLFTTDVKVAGRSAKLLNAAGGVLMEELGGSTLDEEEVKAIASKAEGYLRSALEIHPNYKNALLLMGNAHFYQNEYEEAINYYERALSMDPDYRDALKNIFLAYRNGGRFYGEKKGDLERSIRLLEKAAEMRPDDFETQRLLGVAYGLKKDSARAIAHFRRAVELKPGDANTWMNLGRAYMNAGQEDKAKEAFAEAARIDPKIMEN